MSCMHLPDQNLPGAGEGQQFQVCRQGHHSPRGMSHSYRLAFGGLPACRLGQRASLDMFEFCSAAVWV